MNTKKLLEREINVGFNLNPSYYSNKIIENYYETVKNLYKIKIDIPFDEVKKSVDSLDISKNGNYMVTAIGKNLLFWDLNNSYSVSKPKKMDINCSCAFDVMFNKNNSKIIYSGTDLVKENFYLHVNDIETGKVSKDISTFSMVKDFSTNPANADVVLFANRNKKIFSYDMRNSEPIEIKIKNLEKEFIFCSLQYHPGLEDLILVSTNNNENELFTLDLRNESIIKEYNLPYYCKNKMLYAQYNKKGTQILVAKNNVGPIIFNSEESLPVHEFNAFGYYSSEITHHCCFAGIEDEYIAAASYDFNVYMWKIPTTNDQEEFFFKKINETKFILKGHVSEIRGISYNYSKSFLASFAGDKKLLFWSPLPIYSKLKDVDLDSIHKKNQEVDLAYKSSLQNQLPELYHIFFWHHFFDFLLGNQFYCGLKKVFEVETEKLENSFLENLSIKFIHSIIINYKINEKYKNMKLLKILKDVLNSYYLNNLAIDEQNLPLIFECKKIFQKKLLIMNSIDFLNFNIKLSILIKDRLISSSDKPEKEKEERLKSLEKITLIMKAMIYDLIIIYKMNKDLYEVSINLAVQFLGELDISDAFDPDYCDFLDSIFKEDDQVINKDEKSDFESEEDYSQGDLDSNDGNGFFINGDTESYGSDNFFLKSGTGSVKTSSSTVDEETIGSFASFDDSDSTSENSDENSDDSKTESFVSDISIFRVEKDVSKINLSTFLEDIDFITKYNFPEETDFNTGKDSKDLNINNLEKNNLNFDENLTKVDLNFCIVIEDEKNFNLMNYYNEEVLSKLTKDPSFVQKFNKSMNSLRPFKLDFLKEYYYRN